MFRSSALALIAQTGKDGRTGLIVLSQCAHDESPPRYMEMSRNDTTVLSYGQGYEFVADHAEDVIDIKASRLWEQNGVLVLAGASSFLRVACARGQGYDSVFYDIASGGISERPEIPGIVLIGRWELRSPPINAVAFLALHS